jgi:hypothetical protein
MPLVDINGGAIDGATLGVAVPSSVAATTLTASGNVILCDNVSDTLTVNGTVTAVEAVTMQDNVSLGTSSSDVITVAGATTINAVSGCNTVVGSTNGNQTIDIASHDQVDGGLKLAGTLVTASAAELNVCDGGITSLGTIATGTWEATDVAVAHGGTGVSTLTDGGILVGSGTGAITAMAVLADGEMIVGDGTTDPVAESGATLRTSIGLGNVSNTADANQTSVGALGSGSITSGFGTINNGSSTITTTGAVSVGTFTSGTINSGTFSGSTVKDHGSNFIALQSGNSATAYSWSGTENTAVGGGYTGRYNRYGDQNVMVGHNAGQGIGWSNYSGGGSKNTCVGYQSGYNISSTHGATGYNNMCLGYYSGYSSSPSGSITTGNNIICLGDNSISALYCADDSISTSDGRDKTDVEDFTAGLDWIEAMRPVTFRWDKRSWYTEYDEETGEITSEGTPDGTHKKDKKNLGFIGQEVLAIEQAHGFASDKNDMLTVNMNEDDTAYGMKYARLVPVLVNAIKELSAKVKVLEAA